MNTSYVYALESPDGILIGLTSDPERSVRMFQAIYAGSSRLIGSRPATADEYHAVISTIEAWRLPSGFFPDDGRVLGFLAALPPYRCELRLVSDREMRA